MFALTCRCPPRASSAPPPCATPTATGSASWRISSRKPVPPPVMRGDGEGTAAPIGGGRSCSETPTGCGDRRAFESVAAGTGARSVPRRDVERELVAGQARRGRAVRRSGAARRGVPAGDQGGRLVGGDGGVVRRARLRGGGGGPWR